MFMIDRSCQRVLLKMQHRKCLNTIPLLQEAITPNYSRHFALQQLKFLKISESNLSLDLKTPTVMFPKFVNSLVTIVNRLRLLFPDSFRVLFSVRKCIAVRFPVL